MIFTKRSFHDSSIMRKRHLPINFHIGIWMYMIDTEWPPTFTKWNHVRKLMQCWNALARAATEFYIWILHKKRSSAGEKSLSQLRRLSRIDVTTETYNPYVVTQCYDEQRRLLDHARSSSACFNLPSDVLAVRSKELESCDPTFCKYRTHLYDK